MWVHKASNKNENNITEVWQSLETSLNRRTEKYTHIWEYAYALPKKKYIWSKKQNKYYIDKYYLDTKRGSANSKV